MSKRTQLTDIREDEEDQDLKDIIQKYIKKSEELEKRESKVLKQVELVQSAVASLQAWNQKVFSTASHSVHVDIRKIEEESKKIKEETERIQKEVRQKIEENKKLQDEVDRRKSLDGKKKDEFELLLDEEQGIRGTERKEIECRSTKTIDFLEDDSDPGAEFVSDKLLNLKEMRRESEIEKKKKMNDLESMSLSESKKFEGESKVDEHPVDV